MSKLEGAHKVAADLLTTVTNNHHCWGHWEGFPAGFPEEIEASIVAAILAAKAEEREACAQIAAKMSNPYTGGARSVAGEHGMAIADAIRQGGEG